MTLETKGKSKITAEQVIAARKLKAKQPDMSMQAIKDKLGLKIHTIMVGRAIRGITHAHLDMCGLPVRPFEHTAPIQRRLERKAAKAAAKVEKETKPVAKTAKPAKLRTSRPSSWDRRSGRSKQQRRPLNRPPPLLASNENSPNDDNQPGPQAPAFFVFMP